MTLINKLGCKLQESKYSIISKTSSPIVKLKSIGQPTLSIVPTAS